MIPTGQFWHSSRGQLVRILRLAEHTVSELAQRVRLTENAVRAQLVSLERDGLVRLSGRRPGIRRPNYTYELTSRAEHLFPKAYAPVLTQVLSALPRNLSADQQRQLIADVGAALAAPYLPELMAVPFQERLERVVAILDSLGGSVALTTTSGMLQLEGSACPLSGVVQDAENPAACQIMSAMISAMLGTDVAERCQRSERPRCCFQVTAPAQARAD